MRSAQVKHAATAIKPVEALVRSVPRGLVAPALALMLLRAATPAGAQVPGLPDINAIAGGEAKPAPAVINWASAPVEVNGTVLFRRYARDPETARLRADIASLRLAEIVRLEAGGATPDVRVNPDGQPPVDIQVGEHAVLTITDADTQATGVEAERLGQMWANEIRRALALAQEERLSLIHI